MSKELETPASPTVSNSFNNPGRYTDPVGNPGDAKIDTPTSPAFPGSFKRVDGRLESHPINSESGKGLSKADVIDSPAKGIITKGS